MIDRGVREILICQIEESAEMLVGERVSPGPLTAAEPIVLSPTKQTEKIRKPVYFGVRRTMRKGRVNVLYCPVFSIHDTPAWKIC